MVAVERVEEGVGLLARSIEPVRGDVLVELLLGDHPVAVCVEGAQPVNGPHVLLLEHLGQLDR